MASRAITRGVAPPKVLPPPSPFGELLRRSNFASYDPAIRQTYSAPASYVHRGNWGLKRPIANRKRDSAIVLRKFEEHAQFIEWDKASLQVDFVKRVEEMNIQPALSPLHPWAQGLGSLSDTIDSDFCPTDLNPENFPKPPAEPVIDTSSSDEILSVKSRPTGGYHIPLQQFGNKGKGAYGKDSSQAVNLGLGRSNIQPNIGSMTPAKFDEYLEEIRQMRPEFLKYVRTELKNNRGIVDANKVDPDILEDGELLLVLGKEVSDKMLHRYFLGSQAQKKFEAQTAAAEELDEADVTKYANVPQPIQGQPHKSAGLIYSNPTRLETFFTSRPANGLILQDVGSTFHQAEAEFVAAFAGLSAKLRKQDSGTGAHALLQPFSEEGLNVPITPAYAGKDSAIEFKNVERKMRITKLTLKTPPAVVGTHVPNKSMLKVGVEARVVAASINEHDISNPHKPGSRKFNSEAPQAYHKTSRAYNLFENTRQMRSSIRPRSSSLDDKDKFEQHRVTLSAVQRLALGLK